MDLKVSYSKDTLDFDLNLKNWELEYDDGLESSILISLYSDARVSLEELQPGEISRRGFWGDAVDNPENHNTGSKLWMLDRATITSELLESAREWCEEALQWLIDDRIAESVTVTTAYKPTDRSVMEIGIQIVRPTGNRVAYKFDFVWEDRVSGI